MPISCTDSRKLLWMVEPFKINKFWFSSIFLSCLLFHLIQRNIFIRKKRDAFFQPALLCWLGILWLGSIFLEQPSLPIPPPSVQWTQNPCSAWGLVLVINWGGGGAAAGGDWEGTAGWMSPAAKYWLRHYFLLDISQSEVQSPSQDCLGSSLKCRFKASETRMGMRWVGSRNWYFSKFLWCSQRWESLL